MKEKRKGLVIIGLLILVVVMMSGCIEEKTTSEVPKETLQPLTITSLPYSWTEGDIMITIHEVFPADSKTEEGWVAEERQQYKVLISYENLAHRTSESRASVGYLRLMTDRGNLYEPRYSGGESSFGRLDPEYRYETHNYAFNIRKDEKPIELWKYEDSRDEQPSIIFKNLD
jgi:hypothetical protein